MRLAAFFPTIKTKKTRPLKGFLKDLTNGVLERESRFPELCCGYTYCAFKFSFRFVSAKSAASLLKWKKVRDDAQKD